MQSNKNRIRFLVVGAVIAAVYAALTYLAGMLNLAYGEVQFRVSEALTVLPIFSAAAVPGLTVGCLLGNLTSPYPLDLIFGTAATLFAAIASRLLRKITFRGFPWLSLLPPVLINGIVVGCEVSFFMPDGFTWPVFWATCASVAAGEAAVVLLLGVPLILLMKKKNFSFPSF